MQYWNELSESEQQLLLSDIDAVNFDELKFFYDQVKNDMGDTIKQLDSLMQPISTESIGSSIRSSKSERKSYELKGLKAVASSEVAVILLAGGQGTRLGVTYPKGMYSVNLLSGKTLYQLQAERLLRLQQLASKAFDKCCAIPWYIMTSESTRDSTESFFREHHYFGLSPQNVIFFEQDNLPCLDFEGKVILDEKNRLSKAPNGNGGLYRALRKYKIVDDMTKRGVKYVHVYCVDNILVKMADPIFMGFCIEKRAQCAAKFVKKTVATEPVGVICKVNGQYQVVEYSEISPKTAQDRAEDGQLKYNAGNICNHFFDFDFLKEICMYHEPQLKHHVAVKKIPYVDQLGIREKPLKPNGIKLEKFVFDVFRFAKNFVVWEVLREDEFSPLKNADGAEKDTPATCKNDLMSLHYRWLISAGAIFHHEPGSPIPFIQSRQDYSDQLNTICEISPLVSYDGEGLVEFVEGKSFEPPLVIEYDSSNDAVTFNGLKMKEFDERIRYQIKPAADKNVFNFLTKAN